MGDTPHKTPEPGADGRLLEEIRERLAGSSGRPLWRSLEELARAPGFEEVLGREFPELATELPDGVSRRRFLQLMSASVALGGLTACTRQPLEKIVPYVEQPENLVPGKPQYFATSMALDGYATGLLAESHMGRPTKVEGNPEHPASLGATDLFAQASVLTLYDPERSQVIRHLGRIRTWGAFIDETRSALQALEALGGARLRILTGTLTSPTTIRLIEQVLARHPKARWHQYSPIHRDAAREGARIAFGDPLETRYDLSRAEVILSLDADFLTSGPGAVRYARDFADRRRVAAGKAEMSRFYAVESAPTATGTMADHRLPLPARALGTFAAELAAALGVPGIEPPADPAAGGRGSWLRAVAADLRAHAGRALVIAGESAAPEVHALVHAMNELLGNTGSTVFHQAPAAPSSDGQVASLRRLVEDMNSGEVDVLVILGVNPLFDAPADLDFRSAMFKVGRRIHLGLYEDETAELCQWHLPEAHYLESWGDARAFDGTLSVIQPLIEPLYGGKTAPDVLAVFGGAEGGAYEMVRETWGTLLPEGDFDSAWRRVLHDGYLAGSELPPLPATVRPAEITAAVGRLRGRTADSGGPELVFRPDPTVHDGSFSNNGWLQECPKPLTKLTWDNAALISPALAQQLGLANTQVVTLRAGERSLEAPVWILPGLPAETVTLHLGYGRRRTGKVGSGTGVDAYALRTSAAAWTVAEVEILPTTRRQPLASTQLHANIDLEGREAEKRHLVRNGTLAEYAADPHFAQHQGHDPPPELTLFPPVEYAGYAWGLAVDLSSCTGCNACVVACQSENNIPVVGKEMVELGREMHWIRIDRYFEGGPDEPEVHHQPVMCQHCEQAPCEVVCPVAATVHSDEGLNDMVYNRCVGTRYCSNNCPYKVRRFNFFKYNDTETPVLKMLRNPDVTVRTRGVMEKCTYCVQRINYARLEAEKQGRKVEDGEIRTACQQVCPSRAIVFGDINDPDSEVSRWKAEPRTYGILTELGTRPRTTYMARLRNPNPDLESA